MLQHWNRSSDTNQRNFWQENQMNPQDIYNILLGQFLFFSSPALMAGIPKSRHSIHSCLGISSAREPGFSHMFEMLPFYLAFLLEN